MQFDDDDAHNVFARLFTYAPRPVPGPEETTSRRRRNSLEDFCTEALAWCLLRSAPFAKSLFALRAFSGLPMDGEIILDTQQYFACQRNDAPSPEMVRGRLDLLIRLPALKTVVAIEAKVAPDTLDDLRQQISDYRCFLAGAEFATWTKRILLLSPYIDPCPADAAFSWSDVRDAIESSGKGATETETNALLQFSEFLRMKRIAQVKLVSIADSLTAFKRAGPLLSGLQAVFEGLLKDDTCAAIFKKSAVLPKMDWNNDNLWYGIWSRGGPPTFYVGFETTRSEAEPLLMNVQVSLPGNRQDTRAPEIIGWQRNQPRREGETTAFWFTRPITPDRESAQHIESFLIDAVRQLKRWADSVHGSGVSPSR